MTTTMKDTSDITAIVVDNGLNIPLAQKLAPQVKRLLYYSPWVRAFPVLNEAIIGDGFEGVERVDSIFDHIKEADLFIFPDIYRSELQKYLEEQGHIVWGSRDADSLEIYRNNFLGVLEKTGLKVPNFERFTGLSTLRAALANRENVYIKISKYRGMMETCHWRDWRHDDGLLDQLAVKLGPAQDTFPFLVFDAIETDLELGGDTYCIDGTFPSTMLNGIECKDKGYLGAVTPRGEMPQQIQDVLDAFGPVLVDYRMRNFWSMEVRVKGDDAYFIDPTPRMPCPAGGAQLELYENLADIIWHGSNGELVEPKMTAKFGAEAVLTSKGTPSWDVVDFDEELRPYVKCGFCCEIDGRLCFPPLPALPGDVRGAEIGYLVATGDTIAETIETLKKRAEMLPDGVGACTTALFDLLKEAQSAESQGIEFSDQKVPDPTTALNEEP